MTHYVCLGANNGLRLTPLFFFFYAICLLRLLIHRVSVFCPPLFRREHVACGLSGWVSGAGWCQRGKQG